MCPCDADNSRMCFTCEGKKPYVNIGGTWVVDHQRMHDDLRDNMIQFIKMVANMRRAQKEKYEQEESIVKEVDDLIDIFVNPGGTDIMYISRDEKE